MTKEHLFICLLEGINEVDLQAWQNLRDAAKKKSILTIEAEDKDFLENEHQRLLEEGWTLSSTGNSILSRVSSYTRLRNKRQIQP